MQHPLRVLVVDPDSTSTTIGVFDNEICIFTKIIVHYTSRLYNYKQMMDQYTHRAESILAELDYEEINTSKLSAVCGRGGLLKPVEGGTYLVNENMLADLKSARFGEHPSNLGAWIAYKIADGLNIPSFIMDRVVVDELQEIARVSGIPNMPRKSVFHALSQKSAAKNCVADLGKAYQEMNLIVAHMGNGITVGSHHQGKVIDVNNGLYGEGPFSPV